MERLKNLDYVLIAFGLLALRATFFGAGIGDALLFFAVCGLKGFRMWIKSQEQEPINEQTMKELNDIKAFVTGLAMKSAAKPDVRGFKF